MRLNMNVASVLRGRMRAAVAALVVGCGVAASGVRAGVIQDATTAFTLAGGYSGVTGISPANVSQRTYHSGSDGPIDVFYNVSTSGGTTQHSFVLGIANYGTTSIVGYRLQLGTTTQDYYHNINLDGDASPDHVDVDDDGDGILDTADNAPWVPNADQSDADADGWGDAADVRPTVSLIPSVYSSSPVSNPRLPVPSTVSGFTAAPSLAFAAGAGSPQFTTVTPVGTDELLFGGATIAPDAAATLTFTVSVPDGLPFDGFVLRQAALVPEPAATGALLLLTATICRRRRRQAAASAGQPA